MASPRDALSSMRPIPFKNANAGAAPPYAAMQVTGIETVGGQFSYLCDQISTTFNRKIVFNGAGSVAASMRGHCYVGGPLQAVCDGTPAVGDVWGIKPSQWTLTKNGVGDFQVEGVDDATNKFVWGRWGGIDTLIGKAGSNIAKGASGSVTIWSGVGGSEAATSWSVTAWALGAAITSAKWVSVSNINGVWYVGCWES